jgi:hypothetical protein
MNQQSRLGFRAASRAAKLAAATLAIAGLGAVSGCLSRPIEPVEVRTTSVVTERLTQSGVNKIDLLLMVDNSASMADKQKILAQAIPDLVTGLVLPKCLDNTSGIAIAAANQPTDPTKPCPTGSTYEFPPVLDIHIGMISSSLGTFGADGCQDKPPTQCPSADTTPLDDHGHLVTRSSDCDTAGPVPTYQSEGFLAWDPKSADKPAGETMLGSIGNGGLIGHLNDLVVGNGQSGCGFESQNEAWYRFLVDPTPYGSIQLVNNSVKTSGIDNVLLQQRKEFMRADSLLAIILLTDETDVSIKEYSSYPLFGAPEVYLPLPRSECSTKGPLDPCCASCGQPTPKGCQADPVCTPPNDYYTKANEDTSIRAFGLITHKARYGIEFMYQPSRYVAALTSQTIADENNKQVQNPIFSNLNPSSQVAVRDPGLVFYAAIVGVPWQLIARQNASGQPDLINGVSTLDPTQKGGFKTSKELSLPDPKGNVFWDDIAGDPEQYVPAKSPYMVESFTPRSGTDPITGTAISPANSPAGTNPINGHEWTVKTPANDIQYACIFPLIDPATGMAAPIDEGPMGTPALGDCGGNPNNDSPLCAPNPNDGNMNTLQVNAKAYPGVKHLAIARGMGTQGIVGSICPAQLTDNTKPDFGYRPAVQAIIDRLKEALHGECLPRTLNEINGQVPCLILEGTKTNSCNCNAASRSPVSADHQPAEAAAQADPVGSTLNCFCEINQLCNAGSTGCNDPMGQDLANCQSAPQSNANGWCYVDETYGSDQANLVSKCPPTQRHEIRFVGTGAPSTGSTLFITCAGE